jgi:hypothetical protein
VVDDSNPRQIFLDAAFNQRLAPGRHAFCTASRKIEVKRLDLRPQAVEITAQEMLTKDRIAARDADRVPPHRRFAARSERGAGRRRVAPPAGAVCDPRGGGVAHARRGALGEDLKADAPA